MSETKGINEKRNVYINQFNSASARNLMPLAAGLLYSQPNSIPKITEAYNLGLEIMRDQPENIVARYKNPFLLAYSCYFWNLNQSLLVAELAKKHYPNTLRSSQANNWMFQCRLCSLIPRHIFLRYEKLFP